MLLGDIHGNDRWLGRAVEVAATSGVGLILQLGDWGIWPGAGGLAFRDKAEEILTDGDVEVWVTGGNHEDYDQVDLAYEVEGLGPLDPWQVSPHVKWLPRGYRFELDGVRFLSLGGAYSIDKQWRTPHRSWWPQEQITEEDIQRCLSVDDPKVDVMLTHDIPKGAKPGWNRKDIFEAWPNQERVRYVVDVCRPKWLFHGHLHYRYLDLMQTLGGHTVRVEGLDCDGSPLDASWVIRDTSSFGSITKDLEYTRALVSDVYPRTHPSQFDGQPPVW